MDMGLLPLFIVSLLTSSSILSAEAHISTKVGVNYGQLGNNLPSPAMSVKLMKDVLGANRVKIYDANPEILNSLKNTGLHVSIMVPNDLIVDISHHQAVADEWVRTNVVPFYPETMIRYLMVGNEVISSSDNLTWLRIVPAMRRIKKSLKMHKIYKVKVGSTMAMDVLQSSYPPSTGAFRSDISGPVMKPLLRFLNRTRSFFFLDVYPYFPWSTDPVNIDLDYALFESKSVTNTDPGTGLTYTNLFDQMLDAVVFAMKRIGYPDVRIWVAETGWPSAGDPDQLGCNIYNAATYNRNVVKKLTSNPPVGTPARPGKGIGSFIFSLYNENLKPGPGSERNFGLMYPNGTRVYEIDLTGETVEYKDTLPEPVDNKPNKGKVWCVVAKGANRTELGSALLWACSQGNETCEAIQPGKRCFKPDSVYWHASFAFSSYWAQTKNIGGTCDFNGLATKTAHDPSFGHCKFPSVFL